MDEQVITTKRGKFGKLQVTLPLAVKHLIMNNIEQSGLSRAEFLRIALMMAFGSLLCFMNLEKLIQIVEKQMIPGLS